MVLQSLKNQGDQIMCPVLKMMIFQWMQVEVSRIHFHNTLTYISELVGLTEEYTVLQSIRRSHLDRIRYGRIYFCVHT